MKRRLAFTDGSHNILEITESIFVAEGRQSFLWPEGISFTKAHLSAKSKAMITRPTRDAETPHYVSIYKVNIYEAFGHTELWWPPAVNRDFCSCKDVVANGQGEFEGHSVQNFAYDFKKVMT